MKKIPGWIWVIVIFVALIASKYIFFAKKEEKAAQKGKPNMPVTANYFVVKPFDFKNKVYSSGKIGALNEIELKPEVSGKLTAIYFKEGEHVNKGTVLVKINDADIQAQLMKNKVQLKLAEEKTARLNKLLLVNGVSQEEFDIQTNEVNSLKADQALLQAQLAKTTIIAPFDGIIGLKNVSEGAFITTGTTIASLVQLKPVYVEFSVPERYSSIIKNNMVVKFESDQKTSNNVHEATIYAIEPKVDDMTKTVRSRAMYNGNETLYPGSFVKVFVELNTIEQTLMVPTNGIIPVLKGQKVIVCKNGLAEERKVITGIRTEDKIQVLEGLMEGDTVLTTGLLAAKPGTKLILLNPHK